MLTTSRNDDEVNDDDESHDDDGDDDFFRYGSLLEASRGHRRALERRFWRHPSPVATLLGRADCSGREGMRSRRRGGDGRRKRRRRRRRRRNGPPGVRRIFAVGPSGMSLGTIVGPSWGHLGGLWGSLGLYWGPRGGLFGPSWEPRGPSWGHLGGHPSKIGRR